LIFYPLVGLDPESFPEFDEFKRRLVLEHLILHEAYFRLDPILTLSPIDFEHFLIIFFVDFVEFNLVNVVASFKAAEYNWFFMRGNLVAMFGVFLFFIIAKPCFSVRLLLFLRTWGVKLFGASVIMPRFLILSNNIIYCPQLPQS
jgi:hypothetical protein